MKGKEEILVHRPHKKRDGSDEKTVWQRNHDKDYFQSKKGILLRNWGHVLTPGFNTCQGRVLQRRNGFV